MVVDRDKVDEEGRAADDHRQEERGEKHLTDPRFPVHPAMVEYFNLRTIGVVLISIGIFKRVY